MMIIIRSAQILFSLLFILTSANDAHRVEIECPDTLFDSYGKISCENEKARLDNFAIQLLNNSDLVGYIFVVDGPDVCAGEGQARAIRAKRCVIEYRAIPWNRVIWRNDGYGDQFMVFLQPVRRPVRISYPLMGSTTPFQKFRLLKHCQARIAQIKRIKR